MWFFVALNCALWILAASVEEVSDKEFEDMTAPQIIEAHGYPVETHTVTTKEGYILTIHRIPYGRKSPKDGNKKVPVLLQHGLLCSADHWLITGPVKGLAFVLADQGYDVWMPNKRGTTYSRKHVSLTDKDPKYWDFSWDEMGRNDMPTVVDYILEKTEQPKLLYIGHSQGTTVVFPFIQFNPQYKDKVQAMFLLAPIAFMEKAWSAIFRFCAIVERLIPEIRSEFLPAKELIHKVGSAFCADNQEATPEVCANLVFLVMGYDECQANKSNQHILVAHTPAGQSWKQILHYCQNGHKTFFKQYDHGPIKNKKVYGQLTPPDYDTSLAGVATYLYYGKNDALAGVDDVKKLAKTIKNLKKNYEVRLKSWNHMDFQTAKDVDMYLYNELLPDLGKESQKISKIKQNYYTKKHLNLSVECV